MQSMQFVDGLKKALKIKGHTYASVAKVLKVSESTLKRSFSTGQFTLKRVCEICEVLSVSLEDVIKLSEKEREKLTLLTLDQEKELVNDQSLFIVLYLLMRQWTPKEILSDYKFSKMGLEKSLIRLDTLGLIEYGPKQRIKLLVGPRIEWNRNGPMLDLYKSLVLESYFDSSFSDRDASQHFIPAELSDRSIAHIKALIGNLASEIESCARLDATLPKTEAQSMGIHLSVRPWIADIFTRNKR